MSTQQKFTFQGTGKLARVDRFEAKSGKPIVTLVFEQDGQWPQWIPIKLFGRLADMAVGWHPGDILEVTGELGGREWNGKAYGDCTARTVEVVSKGAQPDQDPHNGDETAGGPPPGDDVDSVPF